MPNRVKSLFQAGAITPTLLLAVGWLLWIAANTSWLSSSTDAECSASAKSLGGQAAVDTVTPPRLFPAIGEGLRQLSTTRSTPTMPGAVLTSTEGPAKLSTEANVVDVRESTPILNQPLTLKSASKEKPVETSSVMPGSTPKLAEPNILPSEVSQKTSLITPEGTRLANRSIQLERIAQKADAHSKYGFELASRKAYFCARSEFIKALRVVAQGLDVEHRTNKHSRALMCGLVAVKEADDFLPKGTKLEANLNLEGIVGSHCTPVLKDAEVKALTPLEAIRAYFTFAQEQLGTAVQPEMAGSMALHGLGKLHASLATNSKELTMQATEAKAMTFFQASLVANPRNELSANDLGVLLAKCGRYKNAKAMLEHSLLCNEKPSTWGNLAFVYKCLNKNESARLAIARSRNLQSGPSGVGRKSTADKSPTPYVQWVSPDNFAQTYAQSPGTPPPASVSEQQISSAKAVATKPLEERQASKWNIWNIFEKRN